jgi:hypothetical protein
MSENSIIQDDLPWLASAGVVIDPIAKTATVTGVVTLFSKKFIVTRQTSFSLFVQASGAGVGALKIFAANDYDPTRPTQLPGTFVDVTADFGTAGTGTAPAVHNFAASGALSADRMSSWACPYAAIQFQFAQTSGGPAVVKGQFFASEV